MVCFRQLCDAIVTSDRLNTGIHNTFLHTEHACGPDRRQPSPVDGNLDGSGGTGTELDNWACPRWPEHAVVTAQVRYVEEKMRAANRALIPTLGILTQLHTKASSTIRFSTFSADAAEVIQVQKPPRQRIVMDFTVEPSREGWEAKLPIPTEIYGQTYVEPLQNSEGHLSSTLQMSKGVSWVLRWAALTKMVGNRKGGDKSKRRKIHDGRSTTPLNTGGTAALLISCSNEISRLHRRIR
ncbi:hypothetical protein B0H16DRAFT_1448406 [Mycena metata]|uniref:Uncharacterized protein n=1 Tax=Mycena metata TaxID=1033252 RepID=A0AAD7K9U0_9AGAR|nr:hypothetical protein B0H16DRAFT_1448406 [Mycena metata]